jgi:hypothetical protein
LEDDQVIPWRGVRRQASRRFRGTRPEAFRDGQDGVGLNRHRSVLFKKQLHFFVRSRLERRFNPLCRNHQLKSRRRRE